ncbi:class I SAM-dependent methyltransferase [Paractinoplanes brasiliensis]|uniref:class I SAM-dependent methyltransferase n=1 Tax=Paractinoplanes brasiliensis TaxID=52695 RepID=UPI0034DB4BF5
MTQPGCPGSGVRDAAFDLIVSSLSQHHRSDAEDGIRDLRRVLRPGGMLWIYDLRWVSGRARRAAEREFEEVRRGGGSGIGVGDRAVVGSIGVWRRPVTVARRLGAGFGLHLLWVGSLRPVTVPWRLRRVPGGRRGRSCCRRSLSRRGCAGCQARTRRGPACCRPSPSRCG